MFSFFDKFRLGNEKEEPQGVAANIENAVVFRGTNLLVLICAIFIASLGLNINSTAVIIGAMLISPLMGPIMGIGLGVEEIECYTVAKALRKIDTPSILFFLGILLAVSALQSAGWLESLADLLNARFKNDYVIGTMLGLLSSLVDNVPLVAASQGMYDLSRYPTDHSFWQFLALTTGTGGSAIIIGSAAGVAVMGIEKIGFIISVISAGLH